MSDKWVILDFDDDDDLKPEFCEICGKRFTKYEWENRHTVDMTGGDCHAYCCPVCNAGIDMRENDLDDDCEDDPRRNGAVELLNDCDTANGCYFGESGKCLLEKCEDREVEQ